MLVQSRLLDRRLDHRRLLPHSRLDGRVSRRDVRVRLLFLAVLSCCCTDEGTRNARRLLRGEKLERRGVARSEVGGFGREGFGNEGVRLVELGEVVRLVALDVNLEGDETGERTGDDSAVRSSRFAVGKNDSSSFRLTTLAAVLAVGLLLDAVDVVASELVEEGSELVGGFGAEGLVEGGEEFAAEVVVGD